MCGILRLVTVEKGRLLFISVFVVSVIISGCGVTGANSTSGAPNSISVTLTPNTTKVVDPGKAVSIAATIANDPGAQGVTWRLSGIGSLSTTMTAATYAAPSSVKTSSTVTITATSVSDASKSASVNLTIDIVITNVCTGEATGHESVLAASSAYAFLFQGFQGSGAGSPVAIAGSISTDGAGNVTAGEEDINTPSGPQHLTMVPASSSYTVGPDNRGCVVLTFTGGTLLSKFYDSSQPHFTAIEHRARWSIGTI